MNWCAFSAPLGTLPTGGAISAFPNSVEQESCERVGVLDLVVYPTLGVGVLCLAVTECLLGKLLTVFGETNTQIVCAILPDIQLPF